MIARRITLLAAIVLLMGASEAMSQPRFRPKAVRGLVGRFQPITQFPIVAASKTNLQDQELVLGVEVQGEARAYPINMLTGPSREILNDQLGGIPIAATW